MVSRRQHRQLTDRYFVTVPRLIAVMLWLREPGEATAVQWLVIVAPSSSGDPSSRSQGPGVRHTSDGAGVTCRPTRADSWALPRPQPRVWGNRPRLGAARTRIVSERGRPVNRTIV